MAITTLRPANYSGNANWARTGAASDLVALNDNSDASYLTASSTLGASFLCKFDTFTLAGGSFIKQVKVRLRFDTPTGTGSYAYWTAQLSNGSQAISPATVIGSVQGGIVTTTIMTKTVNWNGLPWSEADINALYISIVNSLLGYRIPRMYEIYIDVETNVNPTTTVTSPPNVSNVIDTTRPATVFTYSDTEYDQMVGYQIKIFSAAQYGAGGFSPDTSTPTWTTTTLASSVPLAGVAPTIDLVNGTTYRSYVRVYQSPGVISGSSTWGFSPWVNSQYTIALDTPATPTVTASATNDISVETSTFELSNYGWSATDANSTVIRGTIARSGSGALEIKAIGGAANYAAASCPSGIWKPVNGESYTCSAYFKAAATPRPCYLNVLWYDANNVLLGTAGSPVNDTTSGWSQATVTTTCPNASYGLIQAYITTASGNLAANEIHYVDDVVSAPTKKQRTTVTVKTTDNMLNKNDASFETSVAGWASISGGSLARVTTQFSNGIASMELTCAAVADFYVQNPVGAATSGYVVVPGQVYTATAEFRTAVNPRSVCLQINWYDAAGVNIAPSAVGANVTDLTSAWTQAFVTAQAPALAVLALVYVDIKSPAASEKHFVDKVKFGPGTSTTWTRGGVTNPIIAVERSIDNGVTWSTHGIYIQNFDLNQQIFYYFDYEITPGNNAIYRVKKTMTDSGTGLVIASPYSASTSAIQIATTEWWLKSTSNPALNMILDVIGESFVQIKPEDKAFFSALGRTRKIAVTDVLKGEEGTLEADFLLEANYRAFEVLRNKQETLLLVRGWTNEQWYIQFGEAREMNIYNYSPTYRRISIPWTEVDVPA